MAAISDKNINMPEFKTIARAQTINKVKIQILSPPENFLDEKIKAGLKDTNDDSIVLRLSFGSNSFLLPGDITEQGEFPLAASERENLVSTVLFSPHHGSKTSSSASFLNKVSPKIVIISAGWKNRFNFPHPSIMERYKELGCDVYRTDLNGAVRIKTDGERLEINKTK
jgi:competence protein ComEC